MQMHPFMGEFVQVHLSRYYMVEVDPSRSRYLAWRYYFISTLLPVELLGLHLFHVKLYFNGAGCELVRFYTLAMVNPGLHGREMVSSLINRDTV